MGWFNINQLFLHCHFYAQQFIKITCNLHKVAFASKLLCVLLKYSGRRKRRAALVLYKRDEPAQRDSDAADNSWDVVV